MRMNAHDISPRHVGCLCFIEWWTSHTGHVAHSHAHGLERGQVSTHRILIGRLCQVTEERLYFLTAWRSRHAMDLSYSLGPHGSLELYNIEEVRREQLKEKPDVFVNMTERSNSIQQHLRAKAKKSSLWSTWPRVARHWKEL